MGNPLDPRHNANSTQGHDDFTNDAAFEYHLTIEHGNSQKEAEDIVAGVTPSANEEVFRLRPGDVLLNAQGDVIGSVPAETTPSETQQILDRARAIRLASNGTLTIAEANALAAQQLGFLEAPAAGAPGLATVSVTIGGESFDLPVEDAAAYAQRNFEIGSLTASERTSFFQSIIQFNADQGQRRFSNFLAQSGATEAKRRFDALLGAAAGRDVEEQRQFNLQFPEGQRQFDVSRAQQQGQFEASLAEQQRQADLSSATSRFGTLAGVAPQFGQLALNEADFTRQVLANPADFLARSFLQRGETPPLPPVTQADILNQFARSLGGVNQTIAGLRPQFGSAPADPGVGGGTLGTIVSPLSTGADSAVFANAPGVEPRLAALAVSQGLQFNVESGLFDPAPGQGGWPGEYGGPDANLLGLAFDAEKDQFVRVTGPDDIKEVDSSPPQFAQGGKTVTTALEVGEKGPELVLNPTGAPLEVVPAKQFARAQGGGVFNASEDRGFDIPELPGIGGFGTITQPQLIEQARQFSPPAVRDVLGGQRPSPLQFGFKLPTQQLLGSLTPDERGAFGTRLATEFNTTLADVESAIRQRFGQTRRSPQARFAV